MKNKTINKTVKGSIINLIYSTVVSILLLIGSINFSNGTAPYNTTLIIFCYVTEAILCINIIAFSIILIKNTLSTANISTKTKHIPIIIFILSILSFICQASLSSVFSTDFITIIIFTILPLIIYGISNTLIMIDYFKK